MIDYYTGKSLGGNTRKISIMLAETKLEHVVHFIDLKQNVQHEPWYLAINANGKIPAIVDHEIPGGHALAESGAILVYLAEKTGMFLPQREPERSRVLQWVFWQVGGVGPTFGQLAHFNSVAKERNDYAIARFRDETLRLLSLLNDQLAGNEFVAGGYSIADMALLSWIKPAHRAFTQLNPSLADKWLHLPRWIAAVTTRPAVEIAMTRYEGAALRVGRDCDVLE